MTIFRLPGRAHRTGTHVAPGLVRLWPVPRALRVHLHHALYKAWSFLVKDSSENQPWSAASGVLGIRLSPDSRDYKNNQVVSLAERNTGQGERENGHEIGEHPSEREMEQEREGERVRVSVRERDRHGRPSRGRSRAGNSLRARRCAWGGAGAWCAWLDACARARARVLVCVCACVRVCACARVRVRVRMCMCVARGRVRARARARLRACLYACLCARQRSCVGDSRRRRECVGARACVLVSGGAPRAPVCMHAGDSAVLRVQLVCNVCAVHASVIFVNRPEQ